MGNFDIIISIIYKILMKRKPNIKTNIAFKVISYHKIVNVKNQ